LVDVNSFRTPQVPSTLNHLGPHNKRSIFFHKVPRYGFHTTKT
jgi:hypothetical protein